MAGFDAGSDEESPIASINIVPFVDIALVLLVIFMLTSSHIQRAALAVELPRAASAGAAVAATLNVVYTADERLRLNGEVVDFGEARARIAQSVREQPGLRAAIAADRGVPYGRVVELIDLVQTSGIRTFALDVERAAPPSPSEQP